MKRTQEKKTKVGIDDVGNKVRVVLESRKD